MGIVLTGTDLRLHLTRGAAQALGHRRRIRVRLDVAATGIAGLPDGGGSTPAVTGRPVLYRPLRRAARSSSSSPRLLQVRPVGHPDQRRIEVARSLAGRPAARRARHRPGRSGRQPRQLSDRFGVTNTDFLLLLDARL